MKKTVKFRSWKCALQFSRYMDNDRIAIVLNDANTAEPIAVGTVNLVDAPLKHDEVALNHDFAEEMEEALIDAEVIMPSHRSVHPTTSWVPFRIVKLTPEALAEARKSI